MDTLTSGDSREAGPGQREPGPAFRSAVLAARDSYGRLLALLATSTSDLAAAEDALADAFEQALRTWPSRGVPGSPDAWLLTVARNRLRDEWKSARAQRAVPLDGGLDAGLGALAHIDDIDVHSIPDRRLELSWRRSTAPTSSTGPPDRKPVSCPLRHCTSPRCSPRSFPAIRRHGGSPR